MGFLKNLLASILGFFIGMVLFVVFFAVIIGGIAGSLNEKPEIKNNTVLELTLTGDIPDRAVDDPLSDLAIASEDLSPVGLNSILFGLDKAAKDEKVKGVYLRADLYAGSMGTAEEIRQKILEFRKTGKFVVAYAELYSDAGYYIASACDKIYLNPKGILEFNGYAGQTALYKGLLDKVGLEVEVFKAGKYKSAVEPFMQNKMSDANREQVRDYVFSLFGYCMKNIGKSRGIDSGAIADIANQFKARNAKLALQYKLIDGLKYEDEVEAELITLSQGKKGKKLQRADFAKYADDSWNAGDGADKIAIIYASGEINMGTNESGEGIGSTSLAATLKKARLDSHIKAVVLRVNSPGGSSNASDIIAREIELLRKVKPVIASFGGVAASGGYYIACLADSIFAQPTTITGSIGVFAMIPNTSKMYKDKLGLSYETVPTGDYAVTWRPDEPLSPAMRGYFQGMVNDIYDDFTGIVAKGRKMDTGRVKQLAEGHVYTGIYAKNLKLTDGYGGMQRAIQSAALKANLKKYRIVSMPKQKSTLEQLFGKANTSEVKEKWIKEEMGSLHLPYSEIKRIMSSRGVYMRMPFNLKID
ncbi:MAG: signal peptide peptidase SppA [Sphingomonadales bacterium]|nr:signal peptide peptidase SppA [Sphingomonadales bacterium]